MEENKIREKHYFYEVHSDRRCFGDFKHYRDYCLKRVEENEEGDMVNKPVELVIIPGTIAIRWTDLKNRWLVNNPEPIFPQESIERVLEKMYESF